MSHQKVDTLLAPYALHAVEADEVRSVEEHLASCRRCRDEVAEYRSTAALLGNVVGEAPDGLWERIAAEVGHHEQEATNPVAYLPTGPVPAAPKVSHRPSRRRATAVLAAVAAVVVVLALGFQVVRLNDRVAELRETVAQDGVDRDAGEAVLEPHSTVSLRSDDGSYRARVVVRPDGTSYLVEHTLPPLGADRAYQMWSLGPQGSVSLAVLGHAPDVSAFRVDPGTTRLLITSEPAGGSPAPTSAPLVGGDVV